MMFVLKRPVSGQPIVPCASSSYSFALADSGSAYGSARRTSESISAAPLGTLAYPRGTANGPLSGWVAATSLRQRMTP